MLDEAGVEEASQHRSRMLSAMHEADVARADFEHAVRRLHASGATFREIGSALGLSHQRVHQIVDDGSPRPEGRRRRDRARAVQDRQLCSFCGRDETTVAKLISGPGVYICDQCVPLAARAGASGGPVDDGRIRLTPVADGAEDPCGFCGKTPSLVANVTAKGAARICSECLDLCQEILREVLGPDAS